MSDGIIPNDFSRVVQSGYYHDCCVDLYFYSQGEMQFKITTPSKGLKPEISVKGTMISGKQSVSNAISIRNLSYDVDVDYIDTIIADFYYQGLVKDDASRFNMNFPLGATDSKFFITKGQVIKYSVLYVTQSGEPPERYTVFNCQIAATDYAHRNAPITITNKILTGDKIKDGIEVDKQEKETVDPKKVSKKTATCTLTLLDWLIAVAKAYNENKNIRKYGTTEKVNVHKVYDEVIGYVKYSGINAREIGISLTSLDGTAQKLLSDTKQAFGYLQELNGRTSDCILFDLYFGGFPQNGGLVCHGTVESDLFVKVKKEYKKYFPDPAKPLQESPYSKPFFEIVDLDGNTLSIEPSYDDILKKAKAKAAAAQNGGGESSTFEQSQEINSSDNLKKPPLGTSPSNPVPLNFVKSAYKAEVYMELKILYDPRVFPECYCKISSKLIMGKMGLGSGLNREKEGEIIFQIIDGIKYEFSTTNGGTMSFTGVADPKIQNKEGVK